MLLIMMLTKMVKIVKILAPPAATSFQDTEAFAGDRIPLYILAFFGTFYAYKYYLANDRMFSVGAGNTW